MLFRSVRVGSWKLVSAVGKPWELYDVESDRTELKDRSTAEPARVAALTAAWESINAGAAETRGSKGRKKGD